MNLYQALAAAFVMDEETWRRHASPWSVWTRVATLPLLILAIWSRAWIGWWSLIPVAAVVIWLWLNPRLFPPPESTDNWASKGVLGEWVWLHRDTIPTPEHHQVVPHILVAVSLLGAAILIWGLIFLELWPTLLGAAVVYLAKLWFVDRMVWLYEDTRERVEEKAGASD